MPEVKQYAQGTPSWVDLATSDEKGALKFYGALFGWKDSPLPVGPNQFYHMQQVRGLDAAAIAQLDDAQKKQGVPSHWQTYFTVTSVDEAAKRTQQAGGKLLFGPTDVLEAGRMALVQDPQGGIFAVWQPRQHIGCRVTMEPGALVWNELQTTDSKKAAAFYSAVLKVETGRMPGPMEYTLLKVGGKDVAGIMDIPKEIGPVPPYWMVYFGVADVDASVKKAQSLGAKVLAKPMDVPGVGRFATLQDPQGAVFSVFKGSQAG